MVDVSQSGRVTDDELFAAYRDGDLEAFEELFRRHKGPVFRFVSRYVSDREAAAELTQDIFLKVIRSAGDFRGGAKFTTWLYRIARNACIDRLRRMNFRKTLSLDKSSNRGDEEGRTLLDVLSDPNGDVERQFVHGRVREKIAQAVAQLPDEQREVFLLREVSGLSFAEIAEVVGCPENTAKSRMRYALERLREALAEFREVAVRAGR